MTESAPRSPGRPRFDPSGQKLWDGVTGKFELEPHEEQLLVQVCLTADRLDALAALATSAGLIVSSPSGDRVHPALVESRQQQIVFAKLIGSLRLPDERSSKPGTRLQRRFGVRAVSGSGITQPPAS